MATYITNNLRSTTLDCLVGVPVEQLPLYVFVQFKEECGKYGKPVVAYRLTPVLFAHLLDLCERLDEQAVADGEQVAQVASKLLTARDRMEAIWRAANAELDTQAVTEARRLLVSDPERFAVLLDEATPEIQDATEVGEWTWPTWDACEVIEDEGKSECGAAKGTQPDRQMASNRVFTATDWMELRAAFATWQAYNDGVEKVSAQTSKCPHRRTVLVRVPPHVMEWCLDCKKNARGPARWVPQKQWPADVESLPLASDYVQRAPADGGGGDLFDSVRQKQEQEHEQHQEQEQAQQQE